MSQCSSAGLKVLSVLCRSLPTGMNHHSWLLNSFEKEEEYRQQNKYNLVYVWYIIIY